MSAAMLKAYVLTLFVNNHLIVFLGSLEEDDFVVLGKWSIRMTPGIKGFTSFFYFIYQVVKCSTNSRGF